jgi:hypothetical protein
MPGIDGNLPQAYHDGSWKDWSEVKGKFNGEWENASYVYAKYAGVWFQVWVRLTAPTNGSSSVSGLTATISWTPGVGQEGFKLYRNGVFVKNVAANATSTTDTLPAYNTDYTYTVSAFAGATETAQVFSGVVSAPLTAPTSGSSSVSGLTATISWTPGVGQEGFKLYRNGVFVKNVAANSTSTTDTLPAYNTNFTYTVSAFAGATETAQTSCGVVSAPLTEPTNGSTSITSSTLSDEIATVSWTPGVGQEGFRVYRNGSLIATTAANATSYNDSLPALQTTYTYTVSAFAGSTETAQIAAGTARVEISVPTSSNASLVRDWSYVNDDWDGVNIQFNISASGSFTNVTSFQYSLDNGANWLTPTNSLLASQNISLSQNQEVNVRWRVVRVYKSVPYTGGISPNKNIKAGQPLVRTARTDDVTLDALSDVPATFSSDFGAFGTIVDSYQWRNGRARRTDGTLWSSEFTNSSTRSVRLRRPSGAGGNIDLSFISRSNGWDSDVFTGYVAGTWGISLLGTGWFSSTGSNPDNKCRITLRFNVRDISQTAVAYSIS